MNKSILIVGHCCHDIYEGSYILGGSAAYAAILSNTLGLDTQILTSFGEDFQFANFIESYGIKISNVSSSETTVFENIYKDGIRIQYIHNRGSSIGVNNLPDFETPHSLVLLAPIADEIDLALCQLFPQSIVCATVQGWLRTWDESGRISSKVMNWEKLVGIHILFLSVEDIVDLELHLPVLRHHVPIVVVTNGSKGADLYHGENKTNYPAFPVSEVDPTGAGDSFAIGFLISYLESKNLDDAMIFGHALASLNVEVLGISLPSKKKIYERYHSYDRLNIKKF